MTLGSGKLATMAPAKLPDTSTIGIMLPKDQVAGGPAKMVDWAKIRILGLFVPIGIFYCLLGTKLS